MSSLISSNFNRRYPNMDTIFDAFFGSNFTPINSYHQTTKTFPIANILEDENGFNINIAAPGLSKSDFDLTVDNETLVVSTKEQRSEKKQRLSGFNFKSFSRSFALPENTNYESIAANYKAGILQIQIPTKAKKKPLQIKVS